MHRNELLIAERSSRDAKRLIIVFTISFFSSSDCFADLVNSSRRASGDFYEGVAFVVTERRRDADALGIDDDNRAFAVTDGEQSRGGEKIINNGES